MAMIKCRECEKDISDKAKKCPYCGNVFEEEKSAEKEIICIECGALLSKSDEVCMNCGCPVEVETVAQKEKLQQVQISSVKVGSKTKRKITGLILVLVLFVVIGMGYKIHTNINEEENYNTYIDNLEKVRELMLIGGSDAESLCNLTLKVWGNAIYEDIDTETDEYTRPNGYFVSDFNVALGNLFEDEDTQSTIANIEENQVSVKDIMKKLQTVPEGLDR